MPNRISPPPGIGQIVNEKGFCTPIWLNFFQTVFFALTKIFQFANGVIITSGTGSPEGVVEATPGSLYLRTDGGANTSMYVKESGTGSSGWVAK